MSISEILTKLTKDLAYGKRNVEGIYEDDNLNDILLELIRYWYNEKYTIEI